MLEGNGKIVKHETHDETSVLQEVRKGRIIDTCSLLSSSEDTSYAFMRMAMQLIFFLGLPMSISCPSCAVRN